MGSEIEESRIQVTCPSCAAQYLVPARKRGKRSRCKRCEETFLIYSDQDLNRRAEAEAHVAVACPFCQRRYTAKRRKLGKSIYCKGCDRQFRLVPIGAIDRPNSMADQIQVHSKTPAQLIDTSGKTRLGMELTDSSDLQQPQGTESSPPQEPDVSTISDESGIDLFRLEIKTSDLPSTDSTPLDDSDETWTAASSSVHTDSISSTDSTSLPDAVNPEQEDDETESSPRIDEAASTSTPNSAEDFAAKPCAGDAEQIRNENQSAPDVEPVVQTEEETQSFVPPELHADLAPQDQASALRRLADEIESAAKDSESHAHQAKSLSDHPSQVDSKEEHTQPEIKSDLDSPKIEMPDSPIVMTAVTSEPRPEEEIGDQGIKGIIESLHNAPSQEEDDAESCGEFSPQDDPIDSINSDLPEASIAPPETTNAEQEEVPVLESSSDVSDVKDEIEASESPSEISCNAPELPPVLSESSATDSDDMPIESEDFSHATDEPMTQAEFKPWVNTACLNGHLAPVSAIAVTLNKTLLAAGDTSGELRLWDIATHSLLKTIQVVDGPIWAAAFIEDDRICVAGPEGNISIQYLTDDAPSKRIEAHPSGLTAIATAIRNGIPLLLTAGKDRTPQLWDVDTSQRLKRFIGHRDRVSAVALSPDGEKAVTASWDGSIRVWCTQTGEQEATHCLAEHRWLVLGVDWKSQTVWAGDKNGEVCRWSWTKDIGSSLFAAHDSSVASMIVDESAYPTRVYSVGIDKQVILHCGAADDPKQVVVTNLSTPVSQAVLSSSGAIAVAGYKPEVNFFSQSW